MCPVCIATAAVIAASATSTGGISALVIGRLRGGGLRGKNLETTSNKKTPEQGERHGQEQGD
jgi:hypothetical protein